MEYVHTLQNIYASDVEKVGQRAVDLAVLSTKRFNVPLTFVLNSDALEAFVKHNNLEEKGQRYLANDDYDSLREETLRGEMPAAVMDDIREGYESLMIDPKGGASGMVEGKEEPHVSVIPSPHYNIKGYQGIFQNVQGMDKMTDAVKMAWASLFTRDAFDHRTSNNIREFFSGVIVQKMPNSTASATGDCGSGDITVETWFGFPEYGMGLQKDRCVVTREGLQVTQQDIGKQMVKIARDENGDFERVNLGEHGEAQKVDDKVMQELGRLTKKMSDELGSGVHAYYTIDLGKPQHEQIFIIFNDRKEGFEPAPEPMAAPAPEVPEVGSEADTLPEAPEANMPAPESASIAEEPNPDEQDSFEAELEKMQSSMKVDTSEELPSFERMPEPESESGTQEQTPWEEDDTWEDQSYLPEPALTPDELSESEPSGLDSIEQVKKIQRMASQMLNKLRNEDTDIEGWLDEIEGAVKKLRQS